MKTITAALCALLVALLVIAGCASVVGLDFDTYHEGVRVSDSGDTLQCVPNSTVRCLCELEEGIQTCSESGRLSPCSCRDGGLEGGTAVCGNGEPDVGEACDDGNTTPGDGCSSVCVPDGRPAPVETCPGQAVTVWPGPAVHLELTTFVRGAAADGGVCGFLPQPDRVYALRAAYSGAMPIVVSTDTPLAFSVRSTCASATTQLSCDSVKAGTPVTRTLNVESGKTYFLVLEPTKASATATYSIDLGGT